MIEVILIFILLSGIAEGMMDWLQFRLPLKIKHDLVFHWFWDPRVSWKNKWKGGDNKNGEKFFLSSTILVFLTDGWHLMKWFRNRFLDIAIMFTLIELYVDGWSSIFYILTYRILYGIGFNFGFKNLL